MAVHPYDEPIATFDAMLTAIPARPARFHTAIKGRDPSEAFILLFEALNWAVALEDWVRDHWVPGGKPLNWKWRELVPDAEVMAGVRCAGNRVHHQWADALHLDESGRRYPRDYPLAYYEWTWRSIAELSRITGIPHMRSRKFPTLGAG